MRILFQGDSITDAGRSREDNANLGRGYPHLVQAALGFEEPGKHVFLNRGISGNRIVDIYARIKRDIINLKPDVMSLLIGINDVWHDFSEDPNGVDAEKFYKVYDMLIEEIKAALPDIKIMILEPFVLKARATEDECGDKWPKFYAETLLRAEKAKKIAEKHNLPFIPLQEKFDAAAKKAQNDYWLADGVHPTPMGHELIKNEWLKAYKDL